MFRALALDQSDDERTNARNVSFGTLHGGQFTSSTQSVILNYPALNLAVRLIKERSWGRVGEEVFIALQSYYLI